MAMYTPEEVRALLAEGRGGVDIPHLAPDVRTALTAAATVIPGSFPSRLYAAQGNWDSFSPVERGELSALIARCGVWPTSWFLMTTWAVSCAGWVRACEQTVDFALAQDALGNPVLPHDASKLALEFLLAAQSGAAEEALEEVMSVPTYMLHSVVQDELGGIDAHPQGVLWGAFEVLAFGAACAMGEEALRRQQRSGNPQVRKKHPAKHRGRRR